MINPNSSGPSRRPTVANRRDSTSTSNQHPHPHQHDSRRPAGVPGPVAAVANSSVAEDDRDRGLMMREKDRERAEREEGSIGKAGGVGVGVTRPKRRLSSLPSLPHPFLSSSGPNHRALSTSQPTPSPPPSPIKLNGTPNLNGHSHVANSTYQALSHNLSTQMHHAGSSNWATYRPPTIHEKGYCATPVLPVKADTSPMFWGVELKWISLITLALQNAFLTIIMHYSRITTAPTKTYSAATAVLLNELLKGSISVLIALKRIDTDMRSNPPPAVYSEKDSKSPDRRQARNSAIPTVFHSTRLRCLAKSVFSPDCYKLAIPAILYVIQNNLQYVAASNLDVATFQVTYQMKILTTAFFSVIMLRKRLSKAKWMALVMLAVGVGIVQIQTTSVPAHHHGGVKISKGSAQLRSEIPEPPPIAPLLNQARVMRPFKGFMAVTLACMTSGLAGVYFEFILKNTSSGPAPDLWVRNTQLSLFSLVPALLPILISPSGPEGASWATRVTSSFSNFNGWALGTVFTQTFGGLITAVVIRYSDNIMKGFATSLSIIISFLASVALFSYPITAAFVVGSSIVLAATYLYNSPASSSSISSSSTSPKRNSVGIEPGSPISSSAPILGEPEKEKLSRASSLVSLLGLRSATPSAPSSRKPSATDLKSAYGHGYGLTPAFPGLVSAPGSQTTSYNNSPTTPGSGTVPSGPGLGHLNLAFTNPVSASNVAAGQLAPAVGPGAGLGPGPGSGPASASVSGPTSHPYQYSVSAPGTPYLASQGGFASRGSSPGFILPSRGEGEGVKT